MLNLAALKKPMPFDNNIYKYSCSLYKIHEVLIYGKLYLFSIINSDVLPNSWIKTKSLGGKFLELLYKPIFRWYSLKYPTKGKSSRKILLWDFLMQFVFLTINIESKVFCVSKFQLNLSYIKKRFVFIDSKFMHGMDVIINIVNARQIRSNI